MIWRRWKTIVLTLVALILLVIYLVPVFWMVSSSFKDEKDIVAMKWLPSQLKMENYTTIMERAKIGRWFVNSVVTAGVATIGIMFISLLAGYSLGRMDFPGRKMLFFLTLSGIMMPVQAIMIPLFLTLKKMGMVNNYGGLILPQMAQAIAVFIIMQYFKGIDKEFEEAARLDGASELQILFKVMAPMAAPALITVGIFHFTLIWNDFLWPLVIAQTDDMYTLPLGLVTLAGSDVNIRYGPVMAANVIATLPVFVLYVIFQKYLGAGFAVGELK